MQNWKRAVIFGSLGLGAYMLFTGRKTAAVVMGGVGAAVLASEYPETFEKLWRNAPEYLSRGGDIVAAISRIGQRLAEEGERYGFGMRHAEPEEGSEYIS